MGSTREKSRQQCGACFPKDVFVRGKIWRRKKLAVWRALERVATAWVGPMSLPHLCSGTLSPGEKEEGVRA